MHSLEIVQWDSTRRDHPGYPGRVSGSCPVNISIYPIICISFLLNMLYFVNKRVKLWNDFVFYFEWAWSAFIVNIFWLNVNCMGLPKRLKMLPQFLKKKRAFKCLN